MGKYIKKVNKYHFKENLIGKIFGRLTVVDYIPKDRRDINSFIWKCQCTCGNVTITRTNDLKKEIKKSCGCLFKENKSKMSEKLTPKIINLVGEKFEKLTVLELISSKKGAIWKCKCDCGNIVNIRSNSLRTKHTKSCGCFNSELRSKRFLSLWKNKIFPKSFSKRKLIENKQEIKLKNILSELYPEKYKYVGNNQLWIEKFNPDFVDLKNKEIIELFGCYWHKCQKCGFGNVFLSNKDIEKLYIYIKNDFKPLVIWEHELVNTKQLKQKIKRFVEYNNLFEE